MSESSSNTAAAANSNTATAATSTSNAEQPRRDASLYIKVLEGKAVRKESEYDSYCLIKVDDVLLLRTKSIFASAQPFWDEEAIVQPENLDTVEIVMYEQKKGLLTHGDEPIGKAVIHRDQIANGTSFDSWVPLLPAFNDNTAAGYLVIDVRLGEQLSGETKRALSVTLHSGHHLAVADMTGTSDPYVVFHLLPDVLAKNFKVSSVKKKTLNPVYNESFVFDFEKLLPQSCLCISVWDWDRLTKDDFMGFAVINLNDLTPGKRTSRHVYLCPKPFALEGGNLESSKIPDSEKSKSHPLAQDFVIDLQTLTTSVFDVTPPEPPIGQLRIKIKYDERIVLPRLSYQKLLQVVSADQFKLPVALGLVTNEREDAAWALVKAFHCYGEAVNFICCIIAHEVETTADPNTLFRGNSMASKSLDVYMKLIALPYLKATMGSLIKDIMSSKKSLEVDPTRLEKDDDVSKNWKNLKASVTSIVDAIFKSYVTIPMPLCEIFAFLRALVMNKWNDNENVGYVCISGFIFLRLFVAAILGPHLFGLSPEMANSKTARGLTLIAKTVQNLANLVLFGQKEEYMIEMNSLIESKKPEMKQFLDRIAMVRGVKNTVKANRDTKRKGSLRGFTLFKKGKDSNMAGIYATSNDFAATLGRSRTDSNSSVGSNGSLGLASPAPIALPEDLPESLKNMLKVDVGAECARVYYHFQTQAAELELAAIGMGINPTLVNDMKQALTDLGKQNDDAWASLGNKTQKRSANTLQALLATPYVTSRVVVGPDGKKKTLKKILVKKKKDGSSSSLLLPDGSPDDTPKSGPPSAKPNVSLTGTPTPTSPVAVVLPPKKTVDPSMFQVDIEDPGLPPPDMLPFLLEKFTTAFDPEYAFQFFDVERSGAISGKDFEIILSLHGISSLNPAIQRSLQEQHIALKEDSRASSAIAKPQYDRLIAVMAQSKPELPTPATLNAAYSAANKFFRPEVPNELDVSEVNAMMMIGPGRLNNAELNELSSLSATSGLVRNGKVDIDALLQRQQQPAT